MYQTNCQCGARNCTYTPQGTLYCHENDIIREVVSSTDKMYIDQQRIRHLQRLELSDAFWRRKNREHQAILERRRMLKESSENRLQAKNWRDQYSFINSINKCPTIYTLS